jgi:hypothetical protein
MTKLSIFTATWGILQLLFASIPMLPATAAENVDASGIRANINSDANRSLASIDSTVPTWQQQVQGKANNSRTVALANFLAPSEAAPLRGLIAQQLAPQDPTAPVAPAVPAPSDPVAPVVPAEPISPVAPSPSLGQGDPAANAQQNVDRLNRLGEQRYEVPGSRGSMAPSFTFNNPAGFGADNGRIFLNGSYQSRTRYTNTSDGEATIGIGLGDAVNAIGVELSYSINSFGTSQNFGNGGFNAKIHKRFGDSSLALGWNRFASINTRGNSDYPTNSYYAAATTVLRTGDSLDSLFSRVALTAGVGGGQFLEERLSGSSNPTGVGVFGSAAVRIARPLSAIVEWTGQDLAAGLSLVPVESFPFVINAGFRDISGAGSSDPLNAGRPTGSRFVLGAGLGFQF